MALTQMQIIQSLGEAMSWFERELNWGVPATELRHLSGRIGELYAALITNGQMATSVNQHGYDVVSADGERISVKTTARMGSSGHISFNPNTLELVDRIIILRINTEEMQIETLLDELTDDALKLTGERSNKDKLVIPMSKLVGKSKTRLNIPTVTSANFDDYCINELESGSIEITQNGNLISPVKPVLREIASKLNLSTVNGNGNNYNTRQLGSLVIKSIN
ncbi:MAG: hypothetical protein MJK15_02970 [Colwellia sp.]|nr:hypothetical protein [Colwellia sp.]